MTKRLEERVHALEELHLALNGAFSNLMLRIEKACSAVLQDYTNEVQRQVDAEKRQKPRKKRLKRKGTRP